MPTGTRRKSMRSGVHKHEDQHADHSDTPTPTHTRRTIMSSPIEEPHSWRTADDKSDASEYHSANDNDDGDGAVSAADQIPIDSADEGDEEFVQSDSGSDVHDEEAFDHEHAPSDAEDTPGRRRLRRRVLDVASEHSDDGMALGHPPVRRLPVRSSARRKTIADPLLFDAHMEAHGYASTPTASSTRRLRRGHADNVHPPATLRTQRRLARGCEGTDSESSSAAPARPERRKLAPSLVAPLPVTHVGDDGRVSDSPSVRSSRPSSRAVGPAVRQSSPPLSSPLGSPPPVIDKPREERSFREFFPDLNVHAPLAVRLRHAHIPVVSSAPPEPGRGSCSSAMPDSAELGARIAQAAQSLVQPAVQEQTAVQAEPSGDDARPRPSRTPSGLSIRLVFSDPATRAPPPLRPTGGGKSTHSYAGTPQSSVVVLAPKRPVVALPVARFRKLDTREAGEAYTRAAGFKRPEGHYVRSAELTEKDLAARVEYDLDDVDRAWLRLANAQRTGGDIPATLLETAVDRAEKEWFDLAKDAQKAIAALQQEGLPAEDAACAVCGEEECDNANAIVFCDGCNLAVHQDCYGVPYIPEGQWLCRRCMLAPAQDVACILCPQRGGAFKKTTANKWAHLLCALWIPEVGIANTVYMEPIDSVDQIPRSRWKLACHLCHRRVGACIQCSQRQCVTAFHPTCARRARLYMNVRPDRRTGEPLFRAFCERHTPPTHTHTIDLAAPLKTLAPRRKALNAQLARMSVDLAAVLPGGGSGAAPCTDASAHAAWPPSAVHLLTPASAETADLFALAADATTQAPRRPADDPSLQLTMRIFNPDRPVLNEYVFGRIVDSLPARLGAHQKAAVALLVARFWALKRSLRHGAPLLKRLHLEPWTASVTQQRALEMAEGQRQVFVRRLRTDLERVRLLVESVRRREREKLRRARAINEYVQAMVDPLTPIILPVVSELLEKRDPRGILSQPVTVEEAPDYFDVITHPMDLGTIKRKVLQHQYADFDAFARDVDLVSANCMAYNKPATYFYQLAVRVKRHADRLLAEARTRYERLPVDPESGRLMLAFDFDIFSYNRREPQPVCRTPGNSDDDDDDGDEAEEKASELPQPSDAEVKAAQAIKRTPPMTRSQRRMTMPPLQQQQQQESTSPLQTTTTDAATDNAESTVASPADATASSTPSVADRSAPITSPTRPTRVSKTSALGRLTRGASSSIVSTGRKSLPASSSLAAEVKSVNPPEALQSAKSSRKRAGDFVEDADAKPNKKRRQTLSLKPNVEEGALKMRLRRSSSGNVAEDADGGAGAVATPRTKKSQQESPMAVQSPTSGKLRAGVLPTAAALGEDPSTYPAGMAVWAKMIHEYRHRY
ncbi:hypothetical protein GGI07_004698 [Coemansia sp. Benny D115]|nr:hypothetical protein GGI07_004698 [Coemansia sp. Benny D115]